MEVVFIELPRVLQLLAKNDGYKLTLKLPKVSCWRSRLKSTTDVSQKLTNVNQLNRETRRKRLREKNNWIQQQCTEAEAFKILYIEVYSKLKLLVFSVEAIAGHFQSTFTQCAVALVHAVGLTTAVSYILASLWGTFDSLISCYCYACLSFQNLTMSCVICDPLAACFPAN